MKKLSLVIAALAMMLGITQCKKQENPVGGKLITQEVTFTTSFGDGSKLGVTEIGGTLDLLWQVGDEIKVTDDAATPNVSTLECTSVSDDDLTGTFEGTITCIEGTQLKFTVGTEPKYKEQHFTEITQDQIYLVGESKFQQSGNYEVNMALPYAILKVDLIEFAPEDVSVKIGGIDGNEVAKVTGVSASEHQFYLLLPLTVTEPTETTLTFTAGDKTITRTYTLASHGFYTDGGNGGYAPIMMKDYLCFTAREAGAQVWLEEEELQEDQGEKMNLSEVYSTPELQWSHNGSDWNDCTLGDHIIMHDKGYKVYFRKAGEGVAESFSTSEKYAYFKMDGEIAASGNVMSLIDPDCKATKIPYDYCFYGLFHDCKELITAPELPAMTLAENCYSNMFSGCTSLEAAPELPAETLASNCYSNMFNGCSNLNYIKVHFTSWDSGANATTDWVSGVPADGTFYCPKDLDPNYYTNWGTSGIPDGWTVKTF